MSTFQRTQAATQTNEDENQPGHLNEDNRPKIMQAILKAWRKEKIYMTKAVSATQEKLSSQKCVSVIGVPGAGKSTAIHHAALSLEDKGFVIYPIDKPEQLNEFFDSGKKQMFLLENVLGIYSINQNDVDFWKKHDDRIRSILGTNTKLVVSIRAQIFNQAVKANDFVFLDKSSCIDFSDETYRLETVDMKDMLTHCLTVHNLDNIKDLIRQMFFPFYTEKELQDMTEDKRQSIMSRETVDIELSRCFPLLCKVFCKDECVRHKPREFLMNPFQAFTKIFENIKSDNKLQFCGLVLCTVFQGKLTEDLFSINCELGDEVDKHSVKLRNDIMEACDLEGKNFLPQIKSALNSLDGVYVLHIENTYKMLHTVFHNVVTYLFNEGDPSFILQYGTSKFIYDKIRFIRTQPTEDPYIIIINDDKNIKKLADRLISDLESNIIMGSWFIANNHNIDDDRLISCLRRKQIHKILIDLLFRQCMWTVWGNRDTYEHGDVSQYKLIELCVQTGVDCNMIINGDLYPLRIAVVTGSLRLAKLLLQNGADKRRVVCKDNLNILHWVCRDTKYNKIDLIKLLKQHGRDNSVVKFITNDKDRILRELDSNSNNLQLEEVLSDYSIKVLATDKYKIKHYVEHNTGKIQLVKHVHDNILTHADIIGRTILHWSADDFNVTKYLLASPCIHQAINHRDMTGCTPYWYVVNNKKPHRTIDDVNIVDRDEMIKLYKNYGANLQVIKTYDQYVFDGENIHQQEKIIYF